MPSQRSSHQSPPQPPPPPPPLQNSVNRSPSHLFKKWLGPTICLLLSLRLLWHLLQPDIAILTQKVPPSKRSPEYYFYNEMSGQVQWENPGDVPYEYESGERYWYLPDGSRSAKDPNAWKYAWVEQFSADLNRPYFHNQETLEASWERPFDLSWRRIAVSDED
ncbi:hypothetical protein CEUSTIGMA_g5612.t1 [Chlamydomonas eustigma]|uniref:WW domain-containing protein n=1 Tax=Chlamydomonas eustigma TaxID=1157962 RepID=A0A250X5Y4_9CHLO|nr:hypothetical protein CEUSTIGMA_g5612.t1 [Chlamydomonas eustigma]|eukprot:GAX78170.1 hypothetical protein CEUSTIGMA_g5612.t1 [Chlamydomonas eustigma]